MTNQIKKDKIKEKWCKDNNIKLITIPYTEYDNITIDTILEGSEPKYE